MLLSVSNNPVAVRCGAQRACKRGASKLRISYLNTQHTVSQAMHTNYGDHLVNSHSVYLLDLY